jgi:peptide/nickel transport system substrate-binding protein
MRNSILVATLFFYGLFTLTSCRNEPRTLTGNKTFVRLPIEPDRLNPLLSKDAGSMQIMSYIFPSLLDFDAQSLELTPIVAKSRPIIAIIDTGSLKGGTSFTYEIRDEAVWDNGSPITAADYVFTFKVILNPKAGANNWRSGLDFISNIVIDAKNPKKFTILSNQKYFLAESKCGTIPILPEYVYDAEGLLKAFSIIDLAKLDTGKLDPALTQFANNFQSPKFSREKGSIVGCGAYSFGEWRENERIVLKKKTNWWGNKFAAQSPFFMAQPEELHFRTVKDDAPAIALLKEKQFDAMVRVPPKDFTEMSKNDSFKTSYNFVTRPTLAITFIGINCKSPKLNDKRTRRALAMMVDIPTIISKYTLGFSDSCPSPFVPQRPYFNKDLKLIKLDLDNAKTLLAAAGWKNTNGDSTVDKSINGKQTELALRLVYAANSPVFKNIALTVQESAAKAGVKIELVPTEGRAMSDVFKKRNYDLFINTNGAGAELDDPKEMWATSSTTPDGANRCNFENKIADVLIAQLRSELDEKKRNELYKKFQTLIYDEQPAIFLFAGKDRLVINKRFDATVMANPRRMYWLGEFKLK